MAEVAQMWRDWNGNVECRQQGKVFPPAQSYLNIKSVVSRLF